MVLLQCSPLSFYKDDDVNAGGGIEMTIEVSPGEGTGVTGHGEGEPSTQDAGI